MRIQHFRLNTDPVPDLMRIQGFDNPKLDKIYICKKMFYIFFLLKIEIYLSLGLRKGRPSYRRSLHS